MSNKITGTSALSVSISYQIPSRHCGDTTMFSTVLMCSRPVGYLQCEYVM